MRGNWLYRYMAGEYDPPSDGHEGEEQCVFCDEWHSPDQFEDGLRCKLCAEADEG